MKNDENAVKEIRPGGYSHAHLDAKKALRREQAEERNEKYHSIPILQRVALVTSRRGENKKELARLTAALTALGKKSPPVVVPATVPAPAPAPVVKKRRTKKQVVDDAKADRPKKS